MQLPADQPASNPDNDDLERAVATMAEAIERLDELGLADERGRVIVEPASAFHWS